MRWHLPSASCNDWFIALCALSLLWTAMQVGVVHDISLNELRLYTDYGRCCRPLFIVDQLSLKIKKGDVNRLTNDEEFRWSDLVYSGYIE